MTQLLSDNSRENDQVVLKSNLNSKVEVGAVKRKGELDKENKSTDQPRNAYGLENHSSLIDPLKQPPSEHTISPYKNENPALDSSNSNRKQRQMISIEKVEKRRSIFSDNQQRDSISLSTKPNPITKLENAKINTIAAQKKQLLNQSVVIDNDLKQNSLERSLLNNNPSIMNNQNISSALSQMPQNLLSSSHNNENLNKQDHNLKTQDTNSMILSVQQQQPIQNLIIKRCEVKARPEHPIIKKTQYYSAQRNSFQQMRQIKQLNQLGQNLNLTDQDHLYKGQEGKTNDLSPSDLVNMTSGTVDLYQTEGIKVGLESQFVQRTSLTKARIEQIKKQEKQDERHKACQRFLDRGNKPVPSNYEVLDVLPALDSHQNQRINYFTSGQNTASASGLGTKSFNKYQHQSRQQVGFGANKQLLSGIGGTISGLNLEDFDEEINGVNLGKLFSVYGPNSVEHKKYQRKSILGGANSKMQEGGGRQSGRSSNMQKNLNLSKIPNQENMDNSFPQYNQSSANNRRNSFSGGRIDYIATQGYENINNTFSDFEIKSKEDQSQGEDEPIVIRLMSSMFSKKKSVRERLQMLPNISLDKLKKEIAQYRMQEKVKQNNEQMESFMLERQQICEKLFQKFAQMRKLSEGDNDLIGTNSKNELQLVLRDNPFYMALKANKEERERLKRLRKQKQIEEQEYQRMMLERKREEEQLKHKAQEKVQSDIFAHTFVDYDDSQPNYNEPEDQEYKGDIMNRPPKDVFTFMNLNFDLPTTYYQSFGDFQLPSDQQRELLKSFMFSHWPNMRTKKVNFKVAFDQAKDVFNVILLGKNCPLSKCCKMTVNFQFDRQIAGGKVICMETLCPYNPIDQFFMDLDLMNQLYSANSQTQPHQQQKQLINGGGMINLDLNMGAGNNIFVQENEQRSFNNNPYQGNRLLPSIRVKPKVQKALANEVSKSIQRGIYKNQSLREVLINRQAQGNFNINKRGIVGKDMISHLFSSDEQGLDESGSQYNVLLQNEEEIENDDNYRIIEHYRSKDQDQQSLKDQTSYEERVTL